MNGLTPEEMLTAGLAGAIVVLCGGFYALFLTLSHMRQFRLRHRILAYTNFLLVCAAYLVLARSLHMDTGWHIAVAFLLLLYLIAPHLIWKLTKATHNGRSHGGPEHD
jgi:hypothetical protein